jgi:photosystem II PsbY protein
MDIDFRVAFVLLPVIAAVSWALFNIAPAAIKQIQGFLNRET